MIFSRKSTPIPVTGTEANTLAANLRLLRGQLEILTESAAKLRADYNNACRNLARGEDADVLMAKDRLDVAISEIEGLKAEIAEKEGILGKLEQRAVEERQRQKLEEDCTLASQRVAESQAEIEKLTAEYVALPGKIKQAEWQFNEALRALNLAKEAKARAVGG